MLLQAEFLAISLVLVYVGAVMVLFLFVVMMLDINIDRLREGFWSYLPLGAIIALLLVAEMSLVLGGNYFDLFEKNVPQTMASESNVQAIGRLMFTEYVYPFELASVILLVGIVAAIALTYRGKKENKAVSPSQQVFVKAKDRLRVLQMPAEKRD
jgi:NADH-quinone oxidoreductase subunit J